MYNSIYPNYAKSYLGINNRQVKKKQDDEKGSQSSQNAENALQQDNRQNQYSQSNNYFPNGEKVAIDYTKRQITISQVLSDFRNTANAIGAPENIKTEVAQYLGLIENQAQKNNPNPQIIKSNLKNASQILDEYITATLKKPSKVVENWVDTLFLQQIDYKLPKTEKAPTEEIVEEQQQKNVVEEITIDKTEEIVEEQTPVKENTQNGMYVPNDPMLKRMFIQAKKYSAIDNKEKALYAFQTTRDYAEEIGDTQACAIIHYEEGKIYDNFDQIEDALYSYYRAAKQSNDNNIKARAHISMGKIYDDFVNFEPAVNHYCAAVSFAGEADNLKLQTKALSDLAQIHAEKYDSKNALLFMGLSDTIANETNDERVKGFISAKNGKNCKVINENSRALRYFGNSAEAFNKISDNENLAKNYKSAAEVMLQYGNIAKAKKLLSKAFIAAQQTLNIDLKEEISTQLATL